MNEDKKKWNKHAERIGERRQTYVCKNGRSTVKGLPERLPKIWAQS